MSGMARSATYDAILGATDPVEGRPFAQPERTHADADVMGAMLRRQREDARVWAETEAPSISIRADGSRGERRRYLAVPDRDALLGARDITAVGFFGQARKCDHAVLFELEHEIASAFPRYAAAGLLSYFDLELDDGSYGFGNLILFWTPDVPPEWFACAAHERAVSVSPEHYHSIRLHKGTIAGAFLGEGELRIERTKYFDFDSDPIWRGVRLFAPS
jgi:hypothetical protein